MAWQWWDDFDRKMCGKWISGEPFEINTQKITIFFEIKFEDNKVEVNFSYDFPNFANSVFYVEYSDNALYCFHNDRLHRAEYILTLENGIIKCKFSVQNCFGLNGKFEKDLVFIRFSEDVAREYEKELKNKYIVAPKEASKIDILKEYAEYGDIKSDVKFEFKFDERENMVDVIEKYNLDELVKGKNDVETATTLLHWFCGLYRHGNPPGGLAGKRTPQEIMAFADKNEGRTNCRGLSLALAQIIRAYNLKAFHITCFPYEDPFDDCHVVVCVYCESMSKFIMFDPSNNLYIKNKAGEIIGVEEFRDILISGGELSPNEDWHKLWGSFADYCDYMAKNLIRIRRYKINGYGLDGNGVILIPDKYMQNEAKNFDEAEQKQFVTSREYFWQV